MTLLVALLFIVSMLIFLTAYLKVSPFLAIVVVAFFAGCILGMPLITIVKAIQKGIGDMMGNILITIATGAMIGKLVAKSGAATVIAQKTMSVFGKKYLQWGLLFAGLIIGIPMFYNVGFVLVIPIIFSLVQQYKLPVLQVAIPMLASLSVAHSFLPPHPSPASLVSSFNANMGLTFFYGIVIALPAIIVAGVWFTKTLKNIQPITLQSNIDEPLSTWVLPSFVNSVVSALLPVLLLMLAAVLSLLVNNNKYFQSILQAIQEPSILMLIALILVTYTLGVRQKKSVKEVMVVYEDGVKEVSSIILIIAASGALKQILVDSNSSVTIASYFQHLPIHPLMIGWLIAAVIRVCLGSATVAGLTTAGIVAPIMPMLQVHPSLMVLSIGAGSIFFSHVNDTGFWMFKEYFNVTIKDTFLSWSLMETIVSVMGLIGVLLLSLVL
jgi:Gnt-I system high-affinity gluconate transporter